MSDHTPCEHAKWPKPLRRFTVYNAGYDWFVRCNCGKHIQAKAEEA